MFTCIQNSYYNCLKFFDTFEPLNINHKICVHVVIVIVWSSSTLLNQLCLRTFNIVIVIVRSSSILLNRVNINPELCVHTIDMVIVFILKLFECVEQVQTHIKTILNICTHYLWLFCSCWTASNSYNNYIKCMYSLLVIILNCSNALTCFQLVKEVY